MKDSFLTKISYFLLILVLLSVYASSINNSTDVNFTDVNSTKINLTKNITNISFEKNVSNSSFNISINTTKNTSFDNLSINSSNNITNKTINVSNINITEKNISTLNISANTTVISYVDIILTFNHDENNKNKNINSIKSEYFVQERNLSKEIKINNKKLKNVENNDKFSINSNKIKKINNNVKNKILKKDELHEQKVQEIKDAVNLDLSDLKNDFLADYPEIELKKFDSGTNSLVVKVPEDRLNDIVNDYRIKNFDYDKNNFKLLLDVAIPSIVSSDWWPIASHSSGLSDVAIVDSGVNSNHNALKNVYDGSSRDFVWHDFTYDSGDRETPREYGNYHGSHCAGIVASNDEVYGLFDGVAPGLKKIINAKIFYQDSQNRDAIGISSSYIYDAFNWSITNTSTTAEVLSNSWGCGADTCEDFISLCADTTNGSDPTTVKIDYYSDLYDVLMVNAAGNSGDCRDNTTLGVPADAYNTITVGAINYSSTINRSDDFIAYYSARGPTVDNRKKPDVVAPGINITAPSSDIYQEWDNNTFVISGGTSMAAPMVSGIAAILFNEGLSALEVKSVIINSAEDINETSWDIYSGWGYVNLTTAYAIKDYSLIEQIPANSTKFYLITNMSEGDKVTLVWNRHANVSSYGVNKLNNLNLELFDACTGNLLNYSNSSVDNVEQTVFNSDCNKSIVKVKSNETFISEDNETFSLSLYSDYDSLGVMNQYNPNISLNISVPEPIENKTNFQVNISLKNNDVINYFDSNLTLNIPVSLDNLTASFFEISRINASEELNFSVNLSSLINSNFSVNATFSIDSFGIQNQTISDNYLLEILDPVNTDADNDSVDDLEDSCPLVYGYAECLGCGVNISSCEDFNNTNNNLSECYVLIDNVSCKEYEFQTIAKTIPFTGKIYGRNKRINNIYINKPYSSNVSVFGKLNNAIIKNISFVNSSFIGKINSSSFAININSSNLSDININNLSLISYGDFVSGFAINSFNSSYENIYLDGLLNISEDYDNSDNVNKFTIFNSSDTFNNVDVSNLNLNFLNLIDDIKITSINLSDYIFKSDDLIRVNVTTNNDDLVSNITIQDDSSKPEIKLLTLNDQNVWSANYNLEYTPLTVTLTAKNGTKIINNSVNFTIDNKPPDIFNFNISNSLLNLSDTLNVSFNYSEENLKNLTIEIYNLDNLTPVCDNKYCEANYSVSGLENEDKYNLTINLTDEADNTKLYEQELIFDFTKPNIIFVNSSKQYIKTNDTIEVTLNVTEPNINISKANNITLSCHNNGSYQICNGIIDINKSSVLFEVWDLHGRYTNKTLSLTIDNNLPIINNVSFENKYVQYGFKTNFTINATDNINISNITVNNQNLNLVDELWKGKIIIYDKNLNVTAYDVAGNSVSNTSHNISFDNIPPESSLIAYFNSTNISTFTWTNKSINLTFNATDNNNVSKIQYKYNLNSSWQNLTYPQIENLTLTSKLENNNIYYRAVDLANNVELFKSSTIKIDKIPPKINSIILNEDDFTNSSNITVIANIEDNYSGIKQITIKLNDSNSSKYNLTYTPLLDAYIAEFPAPNITGRYSFELIAFDNAGNKNTSNLVEFKVIKPTSGLIFSEIPSEINLTNNTKVRFNFANISNNSWVNVTGLGRINLSNTSQTLEITLKNEENFEILFKVQDKNNNPVREKLYTYYLDFNPPYVEIKNLNQNQIIRGIYELQYEIYDSETTIAFAGIYINDSFYDSINYKNNTYKLNTFGLEDGKYNLTLGAYDLAGKTSTITKNITINNSININQDVNPITGTVEFKDTFLEEHLNLITGLNSENVNVNLNFNEILSNTSSPDFLKDVIMYFNISASTPNQSRVYFSLNSKVLTSHEPNQIFVWSNHNGTNSSFSFRQDLNFVDIYENRYRLYFTTNNYSEFLIGESYPDCVLGESIDVECVCDSGLYASGYCCESGHSSDPCSETPDDGDDDGDDGGGSGNGGGTSYDCLPEYECTRWLPEECTVLQTQTRTCIDVNECGYDYNKPEETRSCTYIPIGRNNQNSSDDNTSDLDNESTENTGTTNTEHNTSVNNTNNTNDDTSLNDTSTIKNHISFGKLFLLIILILFTLTAIYFLYLKLKSNKFNNNSNNNSTPNIGDQEKYIDSIVKYINYSFNQNKPVYILKQELLNAGWNEETINKAFSYIKNK